MTERFHPAAWLAWAIASAAVVLTLGNPLVTACALGSLSLVAGTFARDRSAALMLKLGVAVVLVRVVLFGLTGHAGATTLVVLPEVGLPRWLGGFSIGGRVTGEVVAQQVVEGSRIVALLLCFGVLVSVVRSHRLLRMLPRALFEVGLVVGIALTFVPSLARSAREVREAQLLRGHRFRGARSLRALVGPVLEGALERSLDLAASMEARGYGRRAHQRSSPVTLPGVLLLAIAGGLGVAGLMGAAGIAALAGAGLIALAMRAGAAVATRFHGDRLDAWDRLLAGSAASSALLAVAARASSGVAWEAHPALSWPQAPVTALVAAVAIASPAAVHLMRALALRRASVPAPVLEPSS